MAAFHGLVIRLIICVPFPEAAPPGPWPPMACLWKQLLQLAICWNAYYYPMAAISILTNGTHSCPIDYWAWSLSLESLQAPSLIPRNISKVSSPTALIHRPYVKITRLPWFTRVRQPPCLVKKRNCVWKFQLFLLQLIQPPETPSFLEYLGSYIFP